MQHTRGYLTAIRVVPLPRIHSHAQCHRAPCSPLGPVCTLTRLGQRLTVVFVCSTGQGRVSGHRHDAQLLAANGPRTKSRVLRRVT